MFLFKKGLLPNAFRDMFALTNRIHPYNTRNSNCFYIFQYRTNIRRFSIRFQGPKIFNSLNQKIQYGENIGLFSKMLKVFLFQKIR